MVMRMSVNKNIACAVHPHPIEALISHDVICVIVVVCRVSLRACLILDNNMISWASPQSEARKHESSLTLHFATAYGGRG